MRFKPLLMAYEQINHFIRSFCESDRLLNREIESYHAPSSQPDCDALDKQIANRHGAADEKAERSDSRGCRRDRSSSASPTQTE
jgi:hypothetical protein